MYSDKEIEQIVNQYRKIEEPVPLKSAEDVKLYPNDILLNYMVNYFSLSRGEICQLLKQPKELCGWLKEFVPVHLENYLLPAYEMHYNGKPDCGTISNIVQKRTGKFTFGFSLGICDQIFEQLLAADTTEMEHRYPSGLVMKYNSIQNEISANISAFTSGFGSRETNAIYVRSGLLTTMLGFLHAVQEKRPYSEYSDVFDGFEENIPGIVVAHEKCELELTAREDTTLDPIDEWMALQLITEKLALEFLKENGVDPGYFELFHHIRSAPDYQGYNNVSRRVLENLRT